MTAPDLRDDVDYGSVEYPTVGTLFDDLADHMTKVFARARPWPKCVRLTRALWHEVNARIGGDTADQVSEDKPGRFIGGQYRIVGVPIELDETVSGWEVVE